MAAVLLILGMVKIAASEITSFILAWSKDVRIQCILWQAVVKKQIWCNLAGQGYKQSNSKHDVDRLASTSTYFDGAAIAMCMNRKLYFPM
jgi:hypothetical protein